jgi:hypothetical protein
LSGWVDGCGLGICSLPCIYCVATFCPLYILYRHVRPILNLHVTISLRLITWCHTTANPWN